ncbi:MAG: hypothetical protein Q9188_004704 [Gyalolechia gomerana]
MSRNDNYLSLCLEQASLSSLHYRHGCIIVRGGKVIGKGYNDYRPGFDGGIQNNGRSNSVGALGEPDKSKAKLKKPMDSAHASGTAPPFHTRLPLLLKAPLAPPSGCKNRASNYRLVLNGSPAYSTSKPMSTPSVEPRRNAPPCRSAVAGLSFKSLVLKPLHLNSLQLYQNDFYNEKEEEKENEEVHNSTRLNTGNNNVHHHAQINNLRFQRADSPEARRSTNDRNEKHHKQYQLGGSDGSQSRHHPGYKKSQDLTYRKLQQQQRQHYEPTALVVPQNRIVTKSYHTAERMKIPRLNGADLYVARLGRAGRVDHFDCGCERANPTATSETMSVDSGSEERSADVTVPSKPNPSTGSLHEELLFPMPSQESKPTPQSISKRSLLTATQSRPCYRCIAYMHSAGIKRVFWTNKKGRWEGGKVRDLVDALEGPTSPNDDGSTSASGTGSVYVTKSEVLLLKGLK